MKGLRCRPGDVAVVLWDDELCRDNIGRLVKVHGPPEDTYDLGVTWLIVPIDRKPWCINHRDGTFERKVVRLKDDIEHSDRWLLPLRDAGPLKKRRARSKTSVPVSTPPVQQPEKAPV